MRVDNRVQFPKGVPALLNLEEALHESPLELALLEFVRIRPSQINGCAHCLAMNTRAARASGEHQVRLGTVAAWRDTPYFTEREQAALAWCEHLTDLPHLGAPDGECDRVGTLFSAQEVAALVFAVVAISSWNRLAIGLGADPTSLGCIEAPILTGASQASVARKGDQ